MEWPRTRRSVRVRVLEPRGNVVRIGRTGRGFERSIRRHIPPEREPTPARHKVGALASPSVAVAMGHTNGLSLSFTMAACSNAGNTLVGNTGSQSAPGPVGSLQNPLQHRPAQLGRGGATQPTLLRTGCGTDVARPLACGSREPRPAPCAAGRSRAARRGSDDEVPTNRKPQTACEQGFRGERATRIELAFSAWEADVLPLNYARVSAPPYLRGPATLKRQ